MTYISEQLLKTSLSLEPKDFNNDINNIIKHNLKDNIE